MSINEELAKTAQVAILPLTSITEGERRRVDYGDLEELQASILKYGLIQPITVCGTQPPYKLYAGGRRFRASLALGLDTIPARIYPNEPTLLQLRNIELEENVRRRDLSWDERARLVAEIHELEQSVKGAKLSTSAAVGGHSIRDTAKLFNDHHTTISQDLQLARAMENFPGLDWTACKTRNEALKMLKGMAKTLDHNVRAAEFTEKLNSTSTLEHAANGNAAKPSDDPAECLNALNEKARRYLADAYIIQDCLKALDKLQAGSFHLAEVDPPYAIDLVKTKKAGSSSLDSYNEVPADAYQEFLDTFLKKLHRVMAPDSYVLFWFSMEPWFETVHQALIRAGFKVSRNCFTWVKNFGATNSPNTTLASYYDSCFYARKGNPQLNKPGAPNTLSVPAVPSQLKYHPTQRPEELLTKMLTMFAAPNSRVLVPFAGSGVTLKAAVRAHMTPIGYDLSQDYRNAFLASLEDFSL